MHSYEIDSRSSRYVDMMFLPLDADSMGGTALVEAELIPVFESMLQVTSPNLI